MIENVKVYVEIVLVWLSRMREDAYATGTA